MFTIRTIFNLTLPSKGNSFNNETSIRNIREEGQSQVECCLAL